MLPAGRLRHEKGWLQEFISSLDTDGIQSETWVNFVPSLLPAEIVDLSGRELIAAQSIQSRASSRIRIRYVPGVRAAMRFVVRGQIYNIEATIRDPNSRRRYWTLLCSSGVNEG
jgi:SPP1 family predicted phage head-tail adaptor